MGFYIETNDRSLKSQVAGEDILVGLLVEEQGDGTVTVVDDTSSTFDGIADSPRRAEYIADDTDEGSDFTYKATGVPESLGGAHLVPYGGNADGDRIYCRTAIDPEDGGDPISMTTGTIVGVAQSADTDYHGRVVQEGFTDGGATTYDIATGNFIPVGKVLREPSTNNQPAVGFDDVVRVEVRKDLLD